MTSVWILFVVIYGYGSISNGEGDLQGTTVSPTMITQTFKSADACDKAKQAILQSLVLPEHATVKAVCAEDKGPKSL